MKPLVKVYVNGYNLDQLISRIHSKNIIIYDIEKTKVNAIVFSIKFTQYKYLKPLLTNYEYSIKYLGISNFKNWIKYNVAILIAIPFIMVGMWISTCFTWNIKIYGAEGSLNNQIIQILSDNNVKVGGRLPSNNKRIEQILLNQLPNVAQVSCMTRGTTIIINISPKLVYTPETYEPIRATLNGIITNFSLVSGTMAVSVGDFVNKGDILVYPFALDKDGNQVSVKPIAEVKAKAYVVGSAKLSASTTELVRTGKEYTIFSIRFLNRNLFSTKLPKPFDIYETSVYNEYISSVLPVIRTKTTYYELGYRVINYDLVAEQYRIEQESKELAYQNLPTYSDILDEKITSVIVNDTLYSTTTLTISTIIS